MVTTFLANKPRVSIIVRANGRTISTAFLPSELGLYTLHVPKHSRGVDCITKESARSRHRRMSTYSTAGADDLAMQCDYQRIARAGLIEGLHREFVACESGRRTEIENS